MTPIILQWVCVTALRMRGCALFPQAVTGAAAESSGTHPACGSVHEFLCLRVCLSFCLISTSCFILGVIQTQHSCAVSQRKRAWGMGCQGLASPAMLYNCDQQMEGKWGYQLGLIFSLWARLTPHKHNCPSLDLPITPGLNLHHFLSFHSSFYVECGRP